MGCPDAEVLAALLDGEQSDERAQIIDHAASCEPCHATLEVLFEGLASAPPTRVAPGDRVGRYVIEERLGAGGMGVVHAATDPELHRRVAVKLLQPDRNGELGSEGRERLLREARTLARLSHPNVVTVFDIGVHGDHLFLAMELVDGGSLTSWLKRAPRTMNEIIDRLREAGTGLAAAHAAGVVHRDVKPDNILVGEDAPARMTDFGLARSADGMRVAPGMIPETPLTTTHALVGTPVYMPPEQLAGQSADARSDQWSFCATLYEAVAGVRPFPAGDTAARTVAIVEGRIAEPLPGRRVPGWVRRIVLRGLRADPDERWPSVKAVVDALARGRGRRRRALIASAGVAAIATVAIGIGLGGRTSEVRVDRRYFVESDERGPGCNCPYASCVDGRCIGMCAVKTFRRGVPVPGISENSTQEALLGASLDGSAILYASGKRCAIDRLMLARRHGPTYVPVDLTDRMRARLAGTKISEGTSTLAADGQSIIIRTPDGKHFARVRLAGDDIVDVDHTELAAIGPPLTGLQYVAHPILSADQLTFYYAVRDYQPDNDFGPLDGSYASVRTDRSQPFPPGQRIPGRVKSYDYITGVSEDGLTLFMTIGYVTRVLMRASTSDWFGDAAPTVPPPELYGWRGIPLAGCEHILTTSTPGGCAAEDIVFLEAVR